MNRNEEQYAKLSDSGAVGLLCGGLAYELLMVKNPSFGPRYLILGMPLIIIGVIIIRNWDVYYDHRMSALKWLMILLVFDFLVATVLCFFIIPLDIPEKRVFYLLNVITIILLLIISFRKRNKLLYDRVNK